MDINKFNKIATKNLLTIIDKGSCSHEEREIIMDILKRREIRIEKANQRVSETDISKILKDKDLDWEIHLYPLACVSNTYENDGVMENGSRSIYGVHETLHWPIRNDNDKLLGRFACSKDKPIMQNREMIELGLRLANADDSEITFIRSIGEGESIILSIRAGQPVAVGPDKVQRYIYLLDNRTGEHGLRIGFGETTLRCQNQLNFVKNDAAHKIRHTKNMKDKVEAVIEQYDTLAEEIEVHNNFVLSLAAKTFDSETFDKAMYNFIALLTDVDLRDDFANTRVPAGYDLAVVLCDCIFEEEKQIGRSLWTLLQGVTLLTTHKREVLYPRSEMPSLDYDIAYGKAGDLTSKAYQILTTLV